MLDTLIQSKTRLKLLLRFFLNPDSSAYLRGLADEFSESTNSVRIELNRFEEAGLIEVQKLGDVDAVYLTGDLARGLDASIVDITIIGENIDSTYLTKLVEKAENLIDRKIRTLVYEPSDDFEIEQPRLLIFGQEIDDGR